MARSGNSQVIANLKPFDGTGFSDWEFRIKLHLERRGCLLALEERTTDITEEEYKSRDLLARDVMVQWLSDNVLRTIMNAKTAREMYQSLKNTYQKQGLSARVKLKREELLQEESRQNRDNQESESQATFYGKKFTTKGRDFQRNVSWNKNYSDFPFICHGCGEREHKKYQCPKIRIQSGKCNSAMEEDEDEVAFLSDLVENTEETVSPSALLKCENDNDGISMVADSGATNHLIGAKYEKFLMESQPVNVTINVAKRGQQLTATKRGILYVHYNGRVLV